MKQQSEPDKHPAPAAGDANLRGFLDARASGLHKPEMRDSERRAALEFSGCAGLWPA